MEDYGKQMLEAICQKSVTDDRSDLLGGFKVDRKKYLKKVRELSQVNGWESIKAITIQWLVIFTAVAVAIYSGHWAVYILAALIITTRQHALGILLHDACHYRLFPDPRVNDLLSDLLVAFPIAASTSLYRHWHFPHHRFTNSQRDPEWMGEQKDPDTWRWPGTKKKMLKIFLKDLFGLNMIEMIAIMGLWSPWTRLFIPSEAPGGISLREKITLICHTMLLLGSLIYFGLLLDYILLWLLPSFTLFNMLFKFRSWAEHKVIPNGNELTASRTTIATFWEKLVISPCNVHYHLEHHLFPSVPFYNLDKLHNLLMADPDYKREALIAHSYLDPKDGIIAILTSSISCNETAKAL
ncbi:fatty acid desaturase family protein [Gloeothece verrucosa]|uniref:Fatty acid desaturase n=1 Tax=Gloeothece verrucosa (strain PCC 7822) TaxID=497965 RepID=E0UK81_GLOV7|nr:fatty acid desaturase family protein [Gloeothece verrucosa]ADN15843.1 fatty acid desaturase [Gloeothece verrucosa PCC 7822]